MEKKPPKSIRPTPSTWKKIEALAKKDGRSVSAYIDRVLTEHAEKTKP